MGIAHVETEGIESMHDRPITMKEYRQHNSRESCWVLIDNSVYDLTNWLHKHPGGDVVILSMSPEDCTDIFNAYHPAYVRTQMLRCYKIGTIVDYKLPPMVAEFRGIALEIENSTLMHTNPFYYLKKALWLTFLISLVIVSIFAGTNSLIVSSVLSGILMALFFQQVAFIGHDLGHSSVTHSRKTDSLMGIACGNILSGISMGWWKATHNAHHVATNILSSDPDIQHFPFFAISAEHFFHFVSTYHEKVFEFTGLSRQFVPLQAYSYYIVMAVARLNLYVQSYIFLLTSKEFRERRVKTNQIVEIIGLIIFAVWFWSLVTCIPTICGRVLFCAISHSLAGFLHVQITLSHFAMSVFTGPSAGRSFIEHQMMTSMDIDCAEAVDWFHGGLQFQVVHHLFPRVPRHNLRYLRTIIQAFSSRHGLPYRCVDFMQANRDMIKHMTSVAGQARLHILHDIINMRG